MSNTYRDNYDDINWAKKVPKTFKTSWGHEYIFMLKEEDKAGAAKSNPSTLEPTIDDLIDKSRKEKSTK